MSVSLPNHAGRLPYAGEMLVLVTANVTDGKDRIGTLTALARLPQLDSMLLNPDAIGESIPAPDKRRDAVPRRPSSTRMRGVRGPS
jgi:hypothetical protein